MPSCAYFLNQSVDSFLGRRTVSYKTRRIQITARDIASHPKGSSKYWSPVHEALMRAFPDAFYAFDEQFIRTNNSGVCYGSLYDRVYATPIRLWRYYRAWARGEKISPRSFRITRVATNNIDLRQPAQPTGRSKSRLTNLVVSRPLIISSIR